MYVKKLKIPYWYNYDNFVHQFIHKWDVLLLSLTWAHILVFTLIFCQLILVKEVFMGKIRKHL